MTHKVEEPTSFDFHDIVHGEIDLHPLVVQFIDTFQFQRLRKIKQLGLASFVYMTANHTRFEHSIGTSYITSEFVKSLIMNSHIPNLISPQEKLCLCLAGLCHDIGHGPFSHAYHRIVGHTWSHEKMSTIMIDHLISQNTEVQESLLKYGINDYHIDMIKYMILGSCPSNLIPTMDYNGKTYKKNFLFEIVCNMDHGIDTDKMDYLSRDPTMLGMIKGFNFRRFAMNSHICPIDDGMRLCFKDKLIVDCREIFHNRWFLHKNVCLHKTVLSLEIMIAEILKLSDNVYHFIQKSYDPFFFETLNDNIIDVILSSTNPKLDKARDIIKDVYSRRLYKCITRLLIPDNININSLSPSESLSEDLINFLNKTVEGSKIQRIIIEIIKLPHSGQTDYNPLLKINFLRKHSFEIYRLDQQNMDGFINTLYEDRFLFVYYKCYDGIKDFNIELILKQIEEWWKVKKLSFLLQNV